ncbi:Glucuronoxylan 4-O-methyltransferase [Bertholletia excelsa]
MRSKNPGQQQYPVNLKLILISLSLLFLIFLVLRSTFPSISNSQQIPEASSVSSSNSSTTDSSESDEDQPQSNINNQNEILTTQAAATTSCSKISASLAQAMVHYATSNTTPQQTMDEISVSLRVLEKKSPCNFLVFGLGRDSLLWTSLNHGGHTVFLEEDKSWIQQITRQLPTLESYHVVYDTKVSEAEQLMEQGKREECKVVSDPRLSECGLALKGLPNEVYDIEWDLIMVDAPTGYHDGAPGRMTAIYTAGLMARNREYGETHVFVHDVNRPVEDSFSKAFLCEGYLTEQVGRIRHFTIPSHRTRSGRPFCP